MRASINHFLPRKNDSTNKTKNTTTSTLAIQAAVPERLLKPSRPAMIAITRKMSAYLNIQIESYFFLGDYFARSSAYRNSVASESEVLKVQPFIDRVHGLV